MPAFFTVRVTPVLGSFVLLFWACMKALALDFDLVLLADGSRSGQPA